MIKAADNNEIENDIEKMLLVALDSVADKVKTKPDIALVLGSGLGDFANGFEDASVIEYKDIPDFPVSTVSGHVGRFILGRLHDKNIIAMQGRVHHYEGYDMHQVVMPIRLMKLMGADTLILTNAAGGINSSFKPGDLMAITDHITSFAPSPLIGINPDNLGERFPDMSEVYDRKLVSLLENVSGELDIELKKGVYLQTTGPNYETPAEINMFRILGADVVGMSTACEAMAAKHMGMRIAGVSCITNMAAGLSDAPLNHEEVKINADKLSARFTALISEFIKRI